jgi:hypothetical protein
LGRVGQTLQAGFFGQAHVHPGEDPLQRLAAALPANRREGLLEVQNQEAGDPAAILTAILINGHGGIFRWFVGEKGPKAAIFSFN